MVYWAPMMRLFKTWLVLLLMTLLPLQAASAGIGMSCDDSLPQAVLADAEACQHQQAPASDNAPADLHGVCNTCLALCMGALMPPGTPSCLAACGATPHAAISDTLLLPGFVPDGPRRPPRQQFLA